MTDNELDQILDRWRTPMPSAGLRERVLNNTPPRLERRSYRRPWRWMLAIAAATWVLTLGIGQTGQFSLDNVADGLNHVQMKAVNFFGSLWWSHVLNAFQNSHPKIYLDGEARSDMTLSPPAWIGGQTFAMWVRVPGEGRYFIALELDLKAHKGPPPQLVGGFDGRLLEFHAGDRLVRIESDETFGFGAARKVYLLGIREGSE